MNNEIELYHGSRNEFQEFDMARISMTMYGWGFNFTTDLEFAHDFGDKIYTIELPDDSKFLDFETTELGDEIFKKFCEDIESHGISRDFIDMSGTDGSFKESFWMMETNYVKLLGLSKEDAMKRLTAIVKSFGFVGSKYKDIYVIFDKENMRIKKVKKLDESFNFNSISKKILNESLSQMAYHFTTLKKFYQMVDSDKIIFSEPHGVDVDINKKYGKNTIFYFSTTRVRDGRVSFSKGKNVRIELNTDFFNSRFRANAVNFYGTQNKYKTIFGLDYVMCGNNYETENEDRIYSNVSGITGISRCVNRVDIFLPISNEELPLIKRKYYDIYLILRDIYNSGMGLKTFVYNDETQFNLQGKNITEKILKLL